MADVKKNPPSQPMDQVDTLDPMAKKERKGGRPTMPPKDCERVKRHVMALFRRMFDENQSKMAAYFDVKQPTVNAWLESGRMDFFHREKMAFLLGMTEHEFRTGEPAPIELLDLVLRYWRGSPKKAWTEDVVRKARERVAMGERRTPDEWTKYLDELAASGKRS